MAQRLPQDVETAFAIEELFFSRTDARGIILSGNDVFVRVSGFAMEELLGAPHNIIRHPDMPRAVFKLLWDTLHAGNPICAYVKNMAKDGRYYWVFAAVFPVGDQYVSIRLKSTSPTFATVQSVYKDLLALEKKSGMEAAISSLLTTLKGVGFSDYQHFMTTAMVQELCAREALLKDAGARAATVNHAATPLSQISERCSLAEKNYAALFASLTRFLEYQKKLSENSNRILGGFGALGRMVINMSAAVERSGVSARALSGVAEGFQKVANEIESEVVGFKDALQSLAKSISHAEFQITAARFQTEMIDFFIKSYVKKSETTPGQSTSEQDLLTLRENCGILVTLVISFSHTVENILAELKKVLGRIRQDSEQISAQLNGLDIIRQRAKIEAAVQLGSGASFDTHIEAMQEFVISARPSLLQMIDVTTEFLSHADESQSLLGDTLIHFNYVRKI